MRAVIVICGSRCAQVCLDAQCGVEMWCEMQMWQTGALCRLPFSFYLVWLWHLVDSKWTWIYFRLCTASSCLFHLLSSAKESYIVSRFNPEVLASAFALTPSLQSRLKLYSAAVVCAQSDLDHELTNQCPKMMWHVARYWKWGLIFNCILYLLYCIDPCL